MRIFELLGSLENEQYIDFGEFMKAIGTFCMFGWVIYITGGVRPMEGVSGEGWSWWNIATTAATSPQ